MIVEISDEVATDEIVDVDVVEEDLVVVVEVVLVVVVVVAGVFGLADVVVAAVGSTHLPFRTTSLLLAQITLRHFLKNGSKSSPSLHFIS